MPQADSGLTLPGIDNILSSLPIPLFNPDMNEFYWPDLRDAEPSIQSQSNNEQQHVSLHESPPNPHVPSYTTQQDFYPIYSQQNAQMPLFNPQPPPYDSSLYQNQQHLPPQNANTPLPQLQTSPQQGMQSSQDANPWCGAWNQGQEFAGQEVTPHRYKWGMVNVPGNYFSNHLLHLPLFTKLL